MMWLRLMISQLGEQPYSAQQNGMKFLFEYNEMQHFNR